MVEKGLTEEVVQDRVLTIRFEPCGVLHPPVLVFNEVCFGYKPGKQNELYSNLDFGVDLDSRIALVGPNGAGKSTLLKTHGWRTHPYRWNGQSSSAFKAC